MMDVHALESVYNGRIFEKKRVHKISAIKSLSPHIHVDFAPIPLTQIR